MTAKEMIEKSKIHLILDYPFFGSLILWLKFIEDIDFPTGWTDGEMLGYNPKYIESIGLDQTKTFLIHEIAHCILQHPFRVYGRDINRLRIAADYAVNYLVKQAGFKLSENALYDPKFNNMSMDEIYNLLPKNETFDPSKKGTFKPAKNNKTKNLDTKWKKAIIQAKQIAKNYGKLPKGIGRIINDVINPPLDPFSIFEQFLNKIAKNDYDWTTPNKKYIQHGIYMPELKSDELQEIIFVFDTSGSITNNQLNICTSMVEKTLFSFNTKIKTQIDNQTKLSSTLDNSKQ